MPDAMTSASELPRMRHYLGFGRRPATYFVKLLSDLRYSLRLLRGRRGFAAASVLPLALGIAATVGVFTLVQAVLLRPLPFRDPDSLFVVCETSRSLSVSQAAVTYGAFLDWRERSLSFEAVEAYEIYPVGTPMGDGPDIITASVTPGFFKALGVPPLYSGADTEGGPVIGYGLWRRRFGQDRAVVGRRLEQEDLGLDFLIAGVMPAGFAFPPGVEAWYINAMRRPAVPSAMRTLTVIARLRRGTSPEAARRELQGIQDGGRGNTSPNADWRVRLIPLEESLIGRARGGLWAVLGGSCLLLLIACINFTSLMAGRAIERQREFDVRKAIGASLRDITRQLLVEHLVLASSAGVIGTAVAVVAVPVLLRLAPDLIPRADEVRVDPAVIVFAVSAVAAIVILSTLAAAWFVHRRAESQGGSLGGRGLLGWLTVTEIALATTMLMAAGVALKTYARLHSVELGFGTQRLSVTRFSPMPSSYRQVQQRLAPGDRGADIWRPWMDSLVGRVRALPGVQRVAFGEYIPMEGRELASTVVRPLRPAAGTDAGANATALVASVSSDYCTVLGIRLASGRWFHDQDTGSSEPVAAVSRATARRFWGEGDPVGQQLVVGKETRARRVVGVVDDVRFVAPATPAPAVVYLPFWQYPRPFLALVVEADVPSSGLAQPLRLALQAEKFRPVETTPLEELLAATTARPRFTSWSVTSFGSIALLLAVSGIYSVLAFGVRQRRREMAIRLALGAAPRRIVGMVLKRLGIWLAMGVTLGIAGGAAVVALARGLLYETSPVEPVIISVVAAMFCVVGFIAALGPARYASQSDPAQLLRSD